MDRYDLAVIGTGPAGLSAALTAKARNKRFLLFGSGRLSEKVQKAHRIANYLGLPNISGEDMQRIFLAQIQGAGIGITDQRVTLVYQMGDFFSIQADNDLYEATAVILAAGVVPTSLLPGEESFLGRGVSYCATCDAALYKGRRAVIIGYTPKEEREADFMTEYAASVIYIPMYGQEVSFDTPVEVLRTKPLQISGGMKVEKLVTAGGEIPADGIFILRESVAPSQLIPGLEMEGGHVKVDRSCATNIPGCFAAGDVTGTPYQYIKAAGEGNVAVLSAVSYIDRLKNEST